MDAKFTKGPWTVVGQARIMADDDRRVAQLDGTRAGDVVAANARLIAAAPALLAEAGALVAECKKAQQVISDMTHRLILAKQDLLRAGRDDLSTELAEFILTIGQAPKTNGMRAAIAKATATQPTND